MLPMEIYQRDSDRNVHRRVNVLKVYSRDVLLLSSLSDTLSDVIASGDQMKHTGTLNTVGNIKII